MGEKVQIQQKIHSAAEVGAGAAVSIFSVMADITDVVQMIGVWAGAILALLGIYSWFENRRKKKNNDQRT